MFLATGLGPISNSAPNMAPLPPNSTATKKVEKVKPSLAGGRKRIEALWQERPIPVPPPPAMDPVGGRIRRELQRRRRARREDSHLSRPSMPLTRSQRSQRTGRNQSRVDGVAVGPTRRDYNFIMNQLKHNPSIYWSEVQDSVMGDKAVSMARESVYLTQERIKLLDDYVNELQRTSGTISLFNIGYTIRKMKALLDDIYTMYTVLFRHKFQQANFKLNVVTHIYYYTFCFKKYIDIIYYVEAVMVAYTNLMKDNK